MVPFLGLASGIGGSDQNSKYGPLFLKEHLLCGESWRKIISYSGPSQTPLEIIETINRELALEVASLIREGSSFVSVGGDHSSAIGVWSGAASAIRDRGDLGLLWIDAHMDSHTFQTTESGNIHGMPLAALLGHGEPCLTQIGDPYPKVKPENVVLIGIRSFERGEAELLRSLNVKIYYMDEVVERGIGTVLLEALKKISQQTAAFGISFDLDSIDPLYAPAVGTAVPGGIDAAEFLSALSLLQTFVPIGFELVEYNPVLDADKKSLAFIRKLMKTVLQYFQLTEFAKI